MSIMFFLPHFGRTMYVAVESCKVIRGRLNLCDNMTTVPSAQQALFMARVQRVYPSSVDLSLRIMLNCGVAEPSGALAVPKVLARRYRGTIRCRRFAQYPSPSSVCGTKEEVKRLSPVNVSFRVLVFLLISTGGIVIASRLVAPKKAVACCSADVCARNHHHE